MAEKLVAKVKHVEAKYLIDWVSQETDAEGQPVSHRVPKPKKRAYWYPAFTAGKLWYPSPNSLWDVTLDKEKRLYRDIHGRKVLLIEERFPCFDSFDLLYENRFYHWAYFVSAERLICVYWVDEQNRIWVTEDEREISWLAWDTMVHAGLIENEILLL